MPKTVFTLRLPAGLAGAIEQAAAQRGITRTAWATYLLERGLHAEQNAGGVASPGVADRLDQLLACLQERTTTQDSALPAAAQTPSLGGVMLPPAALQRLLFAATFVEAMLKQLNATLQRSPTEMGRIASQARDQARAETAQLLQSLSGKSGSEAGL
jgi:hypothetical protein